MQQRLLTAILFLALPFSSFSQAGTLDSSFGVNGVAKIPVLLHDDQTIVEASHIAQQKDGKFIVAVRAYNTTSPFYQGYIYRVKNNGHIDSSFGVNGKIIIYSGKGAFSFQALTIDSKDHILFSESFDGEYTGFEIVRLNDKGNLDYSFGKNGILKFNKEDSIFLGNNFLALQPDGKILVSYVYGWASSIIFRLKKNGSRDSSFNSAGYVITENAGLSPIAVQSSGQIISGGNFLRRLNEDGTRYLMFGDHGVIKPKYYVNYWGDTAYEYFYDIDTSVNGDFMCLGHLRSYDYYYNVDISTIYRFNQNGKPDSSFGTGGEMNFSAEWWFFPPPLVKYLTVQPDKKFIINEDFLNTYSFTLRYLKNGNIDASFGDHGKIKTHYKINQIFLQNDLKIVLLESGFSLDNSNTAYFKISRYNNDIDTNKNSAFALLQAIKTNEITKSSIEISPNPVANTLNISGLSANTNLTIINANGKRVASAMASGSYSWNIQNLSPGSYFIVALQNNKIIASAKFIKE